MQTADQLIRTKLRPPLIRPGLISRPRLQERVAQGLSGPLTLITAPAGFGKTTLVASSIAACTMPVAWLSLDKNDNRTGRFLNYLVAALRGADGLVGNEAVPLLAASSQAPDEAVLTSLINDLDAIGTDVVLVMDDYQFISSPAVHETVAFLLEHAPATFHLLIATRSDPPLPLARSRARAQIVELRTADLRFTSAEAAEFLNDVMDLQLDAKAVAVLEERTEGWIAGLQMAALSMRDRKDVIGFIEGFSGTHRYILDYLLEEILEVQPPQVQQFLLCTSILERLSGPLCDALLADPEIVKLVRPGGISDVPCDASSAQKMLEMIERANLFLIPLDDERTWYRYHHLFDDLLRARLDQLYPGLARSLHVRAAAWLEQAGMTVEAINHCLSAEEYERAARLVEENTTRLLAQGELNALMGWIEMLPATLRLRRPWLCIHEAYVLLFAGQTTEVGPLLDQAETAAGITPALGAPSRHGAAGQLGAYSARADESRALEGAIAAVRAFCDAVLLREAEALARVRQARELLSPGDLFSQSLVAWALGYALQSRGFLTEARSAFEEQIRLSRMMQNGATLMIGITALARVLSDQGQLHHVRLLLEDALIEAKQKDIHNRGFIARVEAHLGAVLCQQNELEEAHRLLSDSRSHARFWFNPNHSAFTNIFLASVLLAEGDLPGAHTAISEADRIRRTAQLSQWLRRSLEVQIVRGWLALRSLESSLAPNDALAEQSRLILDSWRNEMIGSAEGNNAPMSQRIELPLLTLARVSLLSGQADEALALLEPVMRESRAAGHIDTLIQSLVLTALACPGGRAGRIAPALAALDEALTLAEPGGYVRVFLDEGRPMQRLLAQWLDDATPSPVRDYAARLLSAFSAERHFAGGPGGTATTTGDLVEPLTPRELEVLQLICRGDSNQVIAEQLVITVSTVKKHMGNILGKLGVTSRAQAMVKARQLGLLPKDS